MTVCDGPVLGGMSIDFIKRQMEQAAENKLWVMKNMEKLRKKYGGKYVACNKKSVLVSGDSSDEVFRKLKERRINLSTVVIEFIPKNPLVWLL